MKATITNTSKANQGVYTDDGLKFIEPGQTVELTIAKDYVERVKSLPFLTIEGNKSDPEQKAAKKAGKAAKTAEPEQKAGEPTDDELRAAVVEKYGEDGAADLDRDAMLALLAS